MLKLKTFTTLLIFILIFNTVSVLADSPTSYIDGDLRIDILNQDKNNFHMIIKNSNSNLSIEYTAIATDGQTTLNYKIDDTNNNSTYLSYVIDEKQHTIIHSKLNGKDIKSPNNIKDANASQTIIPGDDGETAIFNWDGYQFLNDGWNSMVNDTVPYAHLYYTQYQIGSTSTVCKSGTNYNHIQISKNTVANFSSLTGSALGGALGAVAGAYIAGIPGSLTGVFLGVVIGYIGNVTTQALMDERGCIWIDIDKNPSTYSNPYNRTVTVTYSLINIGGHAVYNFPYIYDMGTY